jgi:hypothetical protein
VSALKERLDHSFPDMQAENEAKNVGCAAAGLAMIHDNPVAAAAVHAQYLAFAMILFISGASRFRYAVILCGVVSKVSGIKSPNQLSPLLLNLVHSGKFAQPSSICWLSALADPDTPAKTLRHTIAAVTALRI